MSARAWMITLGCVLLLAGLVLRRATAPIDETAVNTDPSGLVTLVDAPPTTVRAVSTHVELVDDATWHPTSLARPALSRCRPDEHRDVDAAALTRRDLGCHVRVGAIVGPHVELRETTTRGGRRVHVEQIVGSRFLAPIQGTQCHQWILSRYLPDDDSTRLSWSSGPRFEGALTLLSDVRENAEDLVWEPQQIANAARLLCGHTPDDALVVIEAPPPTFAVLHRRGLASVRDTGGRVFLELPLGGDAEAGPVRGTLEVHPTDAHPELFEPAPPFATFGVLTHETAAELNHFNRNLRWFTFGGGSFLVIAGAGWSLAKRRIAGRRGAR